MKNNRVGFGVVGLGQISKTHANALQGQEDCYLVGGFNKNPEKADKWAAENNCRAFYSLEDMLADPEIDAVSITTPAMMVFFRPIFVAIMPTGRYDTIAAACAIMSVRL